MELEAGFEVPVGNLPPGVKGKQVERVDAGTPSSPEKPELETTPHADAASSSSADLKGGRTSSEEEEEEESSDLIDESDESPSDEDSSFLGDSEGSDDESEELDEDEEEDSYARDFRRRPKQHHQRLHTGGYSPSEEEESDWSDEQTDSSDELSEYDEEDDENEEFPPQGAVEEEDLPEQRASVAEPSTPATGANEEAKAVGEQVTLGPLKTQFRPRRLSTRAKSAPALTPKRKASLWRRKKSSDSEESLNLHPGGPTRPHLAQFGTFDFENFRITVSKVEKTFQKGHFFPHIWFRIKVRYGELPYEWTIRRTHAEIQVLYAKLKALYRHNPLVFIPFPGSSRAVFLHRRNSPKDMEAFLQKICQLSHSDAGKIDLCHFFGCSAVSFLPGYGEKPKEGFVRKLGGGRKGIGRSLSFKKLPPYFHKKWLTIGDSFVAYFDGVDTVNPKEVLLCDRYFNVTFRKKRFRFGAMIENGYRRLFVTSPKHVEDFQSRLQHLVEKSEWHQTQRFGSFAPVRNLTPAEFYLEGGEYFDRLADALEEAKISIYIAAWWLSPELYLRRPPEENEDFRIDSLLKRKAEQGVHIYIILFKELTTFLPYDSAHTKSVLNSLHENIAVVRHPDSSISMALFKWAHHEKLVVIDQSVAFIGGVDLCFGRYDTQQHVLTDVEASTWPGKDYYNCLVQDVRGLDRPFDDTIDRTTIPRLPWHDVTVKIEGQAARDAGRHFIQRWNWCKTNKQIWNERVPYLVPKANFMVPNSMLSEEHGQMIGVLHDVAPLGTHTAQVVRSASYWSAGSPTEGSYLSAYLALVSEAKHYVYIENQFFLTNSSAKVKEVQNTVGVALCNRIKKAHQDGEKFHVFIILPLKPGFEGKIDATDAIPLRRVMEYQYKCIVKDNGDSLFELLEREGINPTQYISVHGLRSYSILNDKYVTEEIYVHSKVLIVDDRIAMVGTGNLNDRSLLGDRDSEIAVVLSDAITVESKMKGETHYAPRSIFELRCRLMEEHMGIPPSDLITRNDQLGHTHQFVQDPLSDEFLVRWLEISRYNTEIFREAFHPIPDDSIKNLSDMRAYSALENPPFNTQKEMLLGVKGHLTDFPLRFFCDEKLSDTPLLNADGLVPVNIFL